MSRVVSFIDGMTSASAPEVAGAYQQDYTIANNQSSASTLFTIDSSSYTSALIDFELERIDVSNTYRQTGTMILSYVSGSWLLNIGNYQGDDLIQSSLSLSRDVVLTITTASGVGSFKYTSGSMGSSYSGTLKLFMTKVVA